MWRSSASVGPPVQAVGGDEHHVVDAGGGGQVEDRLDDPLAVVGPLIGGRGTASLSKAMVSFMPGRSRARRGSLSPTGCQRAWRMAPSGSARGATGSAG